MKKNILISMTILMITIFLCSCFEQNSTPPKEYGNIEGNVFDIDNGEAIMSAIVTCGVITCTTDSLGFYRLENVETGNRNITATKTNYDNFQQTIEIKKNQTINFDIVLSSLIPGTNLSGTVTDVENNSPVVSAKITIDGKEDFTDANGHYQLNDISHGTKQILCEKNGYLTYSGEIYLSGVNKVFDITLNKGVEITDDITTDKTWLKEYSPYLIQNSIAIDNATLSIEPGTIVKFVSNAKLDARGTNNLLYAVGSTSNPIIFNRMFENRPDNNWEGIKCDGLDKLECCIIEGANTGVNAEYYYQDDEVIEFKKIIVRECRIGVKGYFDIDMGIIESCNLGAYSSISGNCDAGWLNCNNVTFRDNSTKGIEIDVSSPYDYCTVGFSNCSFKNNNGTGLKIDVKVYSYYMNKTLFEENQKGAEIKSDDRLSVDNCNFISNSGLAFSRSSNWFNGGTNFDINHNYIAGNNGFGEGVVDTTVDASGGQYTSNHANNGIYSIGNPQNIPNTNCGSSWDGF